MNYLSRTAIAASVATAAFGFAAPATAAVTICASPGCVQPDSNVLFQDSTVGNPIYATLNNVPGASVQFNGTESLTGTQSQGQARISATDGTLNFLEILFNPQTVYNEIEFNLNAAGSGSALLQFYAVGGALLGQGTFDLKGGGQNFFAGYDAPIGLTRITVTGTSLTDVRQVRLTAGVAAAVPEPGTWALMIVGFGAVGATMRRRRRVTALLQMA